MLTGVSSAFGAFNKTLLPPSSYSHKFLPLQFWFAPLKKRCCSSRLPTRCPLPDLFYELFDLSLGGATADVVPRGRLPRGSRDFSGFWASEAARRLSEACPLRLSRSAVNSGTR